MVHEIPAGFPHVVNVYTDVVGCCMPPDLLAGSFRLNEVDLTSKLSWTKLLGHFL